jgi:hypothetical protein
VLPQFPSLSELYLGGNQIRAEGAVRLAGVLPLCPMLSFLDLHGNQIAAERKLILKAAWSGEPLNLLLGEAGGEPRGVLTFYDDDTNSFGVPFENNPCTMYENYPCTMYIVQG